MTNATWTTTFGIDWADRGSRLFFTPSDTHKAPFGNAMAQGLAAGVSGYLAYQGKPLVAFVNSEDRSATPTNDVLRQVWERLWNQGLASVLVFHCPGLVQVYSLTPPLDTPDQNALTPVEAIDLATLGLEAFTNNCRDLIWKLEDGQYYENRPDQFLSQNRVDRKLLANMEEAGSKLAETGLSPVQARALLLQTLFIAYLEDRDILQEADCQAATGRAKLVSILQCGDIQAFLALFEYLSGKFNGDVFSSPCCFGGKEKVLLGSHHLAPLLEFRLGQFDSRRSQYSLLPLYNFKFIPVELLSAIYDKFQNPGTQRETGSYFTPAYLAQACLDMAWRYLPPEVVSSPDFKVLDPACGSAVFLVCAFQRLVGLALAASGSVDWRKLQGILNQIHGIDINEDALRVGIISLYIALLERSDPPSLTKLLAKGHLLPRLLGQTMRVGDFFDDPLGDSQSYGLILGNPPWVSRKKATAKIKAWCDKHRCLMPAHSTVWGFLWKAGRMIQQGGTVALLIDAKIFFNLKAEEARRRLFAEFRIPLVVNLADACFQLFEGAKAPAALCVLQPHRSDEDKSDASTEYWSPKANPVFSANHRIALSPDDRTVIKQWRLEHDTSLLKRRRWGRSRDVDLLHELERFTPLSERLAEFKLWGKKHQPNVPWWIGQGHKPYGKNSPPTDTIVGLKKQPFVDADAEEYKWILPHISSLGNAADEVHRPGISKPLVEETFSPPMILLKQGVIRETGLLQAFFTEQLVTFQDSIQAIISLNNTQDSAALKILTAVLNSRLAAWFFFHTSAMHAVDRAKVLQNDIPRMPFPMPSESDNPMAGEQIVAIMDTFAREIHVQDKNKHAPLKNHTVFGQEREDRLNELVYSYYGLTRSERQIVEDSFRYIIPSMQPHKGDHPILWEKTDGKMLTEYATFLRDGLVANYQKRTRISVTVFGGNSSLILAEVTRDGESEEAHAVIADVELMRRLDALQEKWPGEIASGVHQFLHVTFAIGNKLYLIKPNRVRHWMPSAALCDVDRMITDLYAARLGKKPA